LGLTGTNRRSSSDGCSRPRWSMRRRDADVQRSQADLSQLMPGAHALGDPKAIQAGGAARAERPPDMLATTQSGILVLGPLRCQLRLDLHPETIMGES
jgi:hypothetical protein